MDDVISILESHPLFQSVSLKALMRLTGKAEVLEVDPGDIIYHAGTRSNSAYLVIRGACESKPEQGVNGVSLLGVGSLFGERGIVNASTRRNTVRAVGRSRLLKIDGAQFRELLQNNERLTQSITNGSDGQPSVYFDPRSSEFRPCHRNLITFINYRKEATHRRWLVELCQVLHRETRQPVCLIRFRREGSSETLEELPSLPPAHTPFVELDIDIGPDERAITRLQERLENYARHFPYILLDIPFAEDSPTLVECVRRAKSAYLFIEQEHSSSYRIRKLIEQLNGSSSLKFRPLLFLKEGEPLLDPRELESRLGLHIHDIVRACPEDMQVPEGPTFEFESERRYHGQMRRIAREIGQCRVGLVLSSGAAKGLAHIGVIQVLEEAGIEVDYLAGTSIGSYIAACWAKGYDGKALEQIALQYQRPLGLFELLDPVFPPRVGAIKGRKIEQRLRELLGDAHFHELSVPLSVVAVNLRSLEREIFSQGDVTSAVCASCTIPGICHPWERNGEHYLDGGIADPLPVDVLADKGVERIISVSTVVSPDQATECKLEQQPRKRWYRRLLSGVNKHFNYFADGNVFDTLMRSIEASQIRIVERELLRSQVLIQPITCNSSWHDFTQPRRYIELGRRAAEAQIAQIEKLSPGRSA